MTAEEIVRARRSDWDRLNTLLVDGGVRKGRLDARELLELSSLYRAVCGDAARVGAAGADEGTTAYLDTLLARAHNRLYRAPRPRRGSVLEFLLRTFPRTLREEKSFFFWSAFAFYTPFIFGLICAALLPPFGPAVMGREQVEMFREMYKHAPDEARSLGEGSMSVSYYIQHNISIAFRVFGTGVFAGLGSAIMLVYQGLVLGTVTGFLIGDDKARNILTFTCSHSAWELTAIVVAGAAGLRMGWALVATDGRTRLASLRASAPQVARLIGGAAVMLAVAACIEGLWSPSPLPALAKWIFAGFQILAVTLYLSLAGRELPAGSPS
jgi:uncharacterized membrane protein SpoIIM required for sporulation